MHSVCRCSLPVWRRSFLKKGTPVTYFCPALDPPLGGSGRKTTTLVRDHEYFIPTKFHQNLSSGSEEEDENVKVYRRTTDDGRMDDGRCAMTIPHLSLWLRWAKKVNFEHNYFVSIIFNHQFPRNRLSSSILTYYLLIYIYIYLFIFHSIFILFSFSFSPFYPFFLPIVAINYIFSHYNIWFQVISPP